MDETEFFRCLWRPDREEALASQPRLRAAKMAAILGQNAMRRTVPESVAQLTGGEYFKLGDARSLERDLVAIGQHLPNRYALSFHPQSPHPGFHTVGVKLRSYPGLIVIARTGYWADSETAAGCEPVSRVCNEKQPRINSFDFGITMGLRVVLRALR